MAGQDERKLFVGKLPQDITEDEIRLIFNTYGRTTDVHLMETSNGQGRVAFVSYEFMTSAQAALQVLDNVYRFREDARDPIIVSVARPRNGGKGGRDQSRSRGRDRSRERSRNFEQPSNTGGYFDQFSRGFDPRTAAYGAYGYPFGLGGCGYGFDPRGGFDGSKDRNRDGKGGSCKGGPGAKLYVSNLPNDISRKAIEMVFGVYGSVMHVHIMSGRAQNGQSCAFVTYSHEQEARTAIAAMDAGYEIRPGEGNIIVKEAHDKPQGVGGSDRARSPSHL